MVTLVFSVLSQIASNREKDDSDLNYKKDTLVQDIVQLFQHVEIEQSTTHRQKIRDLAMIIEDIFLRHGQPEEIKHTCQNVFNLLLKAGLSVKYFDISVKKEKSIKEYVYHTLADQERYFNKYNSSSHLLSTDNERTEDSSIYFNSIMDNINSSRAIDISLLDRRQIQEIIEAKTKSVIETQRLIQSYKLPNTTVAETEDEINEDTVTKEREPERKPDPYAEKITAEKPPQERVTKASQELDELIEDMKKFSVTFKEYSYYMYETELERAYRAFRAFRIYFSQAHNKKVRKTFTQWTKIIK